MNYELATQLKDAGFPQEGRGEHLFAQEDITISFIKKEDGSSVEIKGAKGVTAYAPTLSELIEACGEDFTSMNRITENTWSAWGNEYGFKGSTPEEAAVKLWLAINKK